jgi:hypothetical protein
VLQWIERRMSISNPDVGKGGESRGLQHGI